MSLLKANSVQIGQSATADQNFTLSVPSSPDGTIKLARGNSGATTSDVLTVNSIGAITGATLTNPAISGATINSSTLNGGSITIPTPVSLPAAPNLNFTGIPSWAKKITVMFDRVSLNGAVALLVRLGTSSGFETTGYFSQTSVTNTGSATSNSTAGFIIFNSEAAAQISGTMTITHMGNNTWTSAGAYAWLAASTASAIFNGGSKPMSGVLDRIQILSSNGTSTFDFGNINIMYEG